MYCSLDDLIEAKDERGIIQLSNDGANPQEVDENVVNLNIQKATNLIDTYLSGRYVTPLTGEIPGIIKDICIDLTIFNLYTRRNREISKESGVYLDYHTALQTLQKIAERKINLPGLSEIGQPGQTGGIIKTNKNKNDRYFDSFTMRGFNGTKWN